MGIASLILGIISIMILFLTPHGIIDLIPSILGIILGSIDIVNKKKTGDKKGISIAGLVLSIIALIMISFGLFSMYLLSTQ